MCLGIPGKVVEIYEQNGLPMGKVEFGGILKEICLAYTPEAEIGEYVLVHVGFAISRIDEAEAQETMQYLREIEEEMSNAADASPRDPIDVCMANEPRPTNVRPEDEANQSSPPVHYPGKYQ